jgi:hypothetical protein
MEFRSWKEILVGSSSLINSAQMTPNFTRLVGMQHALSVERTIFEEKVSTYARHFFAKQLITALEQGKESKLPYDAMSKMSV